ncbi:MAG: hypothetical protein HUU35_10190 [Armatimonadetes bacterium]|nr:hypothetical protein [Armatimonadota bacterium]
MHGGEDRAHLGQKLRVETTVIDSGGAHTEHVYRYTHGLPTRFNAPHQLHKDLFTKDSLRAELEAAGYEVVSLENTCYEQEPHALNLNVVARRRRAVAGAPAGRRSN